MSVGVLRIGIVGAGANTRLRHIPGLRAIPGVKITAVCNRTYESSRRASHEFDIPNAYERWQDLVHSPQVDAVVIGTWPYLHCEITTAALAAGKHVLTEARMASKLAEARQMQQAAEARPELVAQVVPSPFGLEVGPALQRLLADGFIGTLREAVVIGADDTFWDYSQPLHWRQQASLSGKNILALGILHETLMRFAPPVKQVFAQSTIFEPQRPVIETESFERVTVPDSVQILTQFEGGGRGIYHLSGVVLYGPGKQIHLYGSRGTVKLVFDDRERLLLGHPGDKSLEENEVPEEDRGRWQVEEDFVSAIRGQRPVGMNPFSVGVQYMEFTEAVHLSAERNQPVTLPLR
jgi:predicted dehydrogenase